jgi:alkylation response protein AidB-like acyl-CoA dehydrogenase
MNFALTEDQIMIRDSAESFLADASSSAAVRSAMETAGGFDPALWNRIGTELGWCGTAIPAEYGGLGLGQVELMLILEQMGRHLLCAPFFSTVCLAGNLLCETASEAARAKYLPEIAEGRLQAAAPLPSAVDAWDDAASGLRATPTDRGWILDGRVPRVPDAATASLLLLFARIDGAGLGLFAVPADSSQLTVKPITGWDATRRFADVEISALPVGEAQRIDDAARSQAGFARSAALARLYLAAEALGGAQQCLDLTVAYTATRKQFGRAVAGFQAVKHRCAEMMVRIEALRSAVYGAAALAAGEPAVEELELECAMTRVLAAESFFWCAQEAIQLHGGVGFTWEYDPQLYFKRAQASSHWLGTADALRERIAHRLIDGV